MAKITPVKVACTPDFSMATHMTRPTSKYKLFDSLFHLFSKAKIGIQHATTTRASREMFAV